MSYRTDETALPTSSLDSSSEDSSRSLTSSLDQPIKNVHFLNKSWPFLDKLDDQYSSLDSWRYYTDDEMVYDICERYSRQSSSPRTEGFDDTSGCNTDASKLYRFRGNHYNPSASGQRTNHELEDCVQWVNGCLSTNKRHITDLTQSFADGQTFQYLVEILLGVAVPPVHAKPALEVQKTENIQKCLDVLKLHGVPIRDNVTTEDIVKKNAKIVLALCQCLRKHFGSSPESTVSPMTSLQAIHSSASPFESTSRINQYLDRDTQSSTRVQSHRFAVMDTEDVAILDWVSNMTNHTIKGYESFQDGHVLCLLVNKLTGGAVPEVVLEYGLPSEKIDLALMFSEEKLGTTTELNHEEIIKLANPSKLSFYLQELHKIFLEQKLEEKASHSENSEVEKSRDKLKEIKACELMSNTFIWDDPDEEQSTSDEPGRGDDEDIGRVLKENVRAHCSSSKMRHFRGTNRNTEEAHQLSLSKSTLTERQQFGPERQIPEELDHYLEFKNLENKYRAPKHYAKLDFARDTTTKERNNFNKPRKILDGLLHHGISDDVMLLPGETMFDPMKWELPFKPLTPKSWEKEREKAKVKINFLNNQLKHLKEQYFRYTSHEIQKEHFEVSGETPTDWGDSPVKLNFIPHKAVKSSSKGFSESFNSDFSKNKGTTPPYRTWSMYINTEGDRYKALLKKTQDVDRKNPMASKNHVTASFKRSSNVRRKELLIPGCSDVRGKKSKQHEVTSPQIKKLQNAEARDVTKNRPSDDSVSVSSNDSQMASGRHLHGITALVRLSSKKANALSSTES